MRLKFGLYSLIVLATLFGSVAIAQDGPPPTDMRQAVGPPQGDRKPNLLQELGLSPDQLQQIRRLNQERRPQLEAAMKRMGAANRALDDAIYSDVVNEADVAARIKEVQDAQADLSRLRFTNELEVRKLLTPDQLVRFRDLRKQFAEARAKFRNGQRGPHPDRGMGRPNQGLKPVQE